MGESPRSEQSKRVVTQGAERPSSFRREGAERSLSGGWQEVSEGYLEVDGDGYVRPGSRHSNLTKSVNSLSGPVTSEPSEQVREKVSEFEELRAEIQAGFEPTEPLGFERSVLSRWYVERVTVDGETHKPARGVVWTWWR